MAHAVRAGLLGAKIRLALLFQRSEIVAMAKKTTSGSAGGRGTTGGNSGRGMRDLRVRVKTARGRKMSSTLWLERQLNDPYVVRARKEGYRGRAAYKIYELDDKYRFLVPGARVVDLGCAPGGWCQVAVNRVNALGEKSGRKIGRVLGVDLQDVEPIAGAELHVLDFLEDGADDKVKAWLGGAADVVMSDMAAAASGHKQTDHIRIITLCEAAAYFAFDVLEPGGTFVAKVLAGGAEGSLQKLLQKRFTKVSNVKPPASRSDSSEKFVVATGFRGRLEDEDETAGEA
jgi:23S rRNA (uridine2552-2'-O)-methyltransferase